MPTLPSYLLLRHVCKLTMGPHPPSDRELLQRFNLQHDEAVFAELVTRHGPMVYRVARRVLHNDHDTEDVFQAAFLVLARKAGALGERESLGPWLFQVARRLALAAQRKAACRRRHEALVEPRNNADPLTDISLREAQAVFDEELARLPERLSAPLVLCLLQGATHDEAVRQLGWSFGTLRRRLAQGRALLRTRLERRGLGLSSALLAMVLAPAATSAAPPAALVKAVVSVARLTGTGQGVAGMVSARASAMADGFADALLGMRWKAAAALLLFLGVLAAGVGFAVPPTPAADRPNDAPIPVAVGREKRTAAAEKPVLTDRLGDPLPPGALARLGTFRLRHTDSVTSLVFTPDSKTVISGGQDNAVRVFDVTTGKQRRIFPGSGLPRSTFAVLSPDGKRLYTTTDSIIRGWDMVTGKEVRPFAREVRAHALALSPNGKLLASAGAPGEKGPEPGLRLWDLAAGKETRRLEPDDHLRAFAFTPNGRAVLTLGGDLNAVASAYGSPLRLWEVDTGKQLPSPTGEQKVMHFALSADGKSLAIRRGDEPSTIRLLEAATGKERRRLRATPALDCICFSPDGTRLVARGHDSTLRLWNAVTGKEVLVVEGFYPRIAAFSPDGKTLAAAERLAIRLWDMATGKERTPVAGPSAPITTVALSPDGKNVAVAEVNLLRVWDWTTGKQLPHLQNRHEITFNCAAFSPDGKALAAGGFRGLSLWEVASGKVLADVGLPPDTNQEVVALAFAPDGKELAWASRAGMIHLRKTPPKAGDLWLRGHEGEVVALAYSADGKTLASTGRDRRLRLWDATTGKPLRNMEIHPGFFQAFSPDGRALAWADWGGKALGAWEFHSGRPPRSFADEPGAPRLFSPPTWLAVSPDGKTVAAAGVDHTVHLWEVATGKERCRFAGHRAPAGPFSFSRDGKLLASASHDGTVLIWDVLGPFSNERPAAALSDNELERLWHDLGSEDATRAYRALTLLTAASRSFTPWLGERFRPARAPDPQQLARLLADLDSKPFARREKALEELRQLAELAEEALRTALQGNLTLETRRRIERLLADAPGVPVGKGLRFLRAVEVLEHSDTPGARQLLEKLAEGEPRARLTQEARAAVRRLRLKN
jgi:RNA polymerase sigma factor (sigma-70 family)